MKAFGNNNPDAFYYIKNHKEKEKMIELIEKINRGRRDNLESRRGALNTFVGAFSVGGKVFAVVALDGIIY